MGDNKEKDENPLKGRQYKLNLDSNFTKRMVSDQTNSRWNIKAKRLEMQGIMKLKIRYSQLS